MYPANDQKIKTILDFGCGTGRHASLLVDKGYKVHGVDKSIQMLNIAKKLSKKKLSFSSSNTDGLKIKKKFDAIISIFHVMSYQIKNIELIKTFKIIKKHLVDGGVFIFDFWYGPAILTDLPINSFKKFKNNYIKISRFGKPKLNFQKNTVDMNYSIFIENNNSKKLIKNKEIHRIRFFFDKELELICKKFNFKIQAKYEWMSSKKPNLKSRSVVWVVKN